VVLLFLSLFGFVIVVKTCRQSAKTIAANGLAVPDRKELESVSDGPNGIASFLAPTAPGLTLTDTCRYLRPLPVIKVGNVKNQPFLKQFLTKFSTFRVD
jgi:hypothetical protein